MIPVCFECYQATLKEIPVSTYLQLFGFLKSANIPSLFEVSSCIFMIYELVVFMVLELHLFIIYELVLFMCLELHLLINYPDQYKMCIHSCLNKNE